MDKKHARMLVITVVTAIMVMFFGPLDVFTHGYFPEEVDVSQIADADRLGFLPVTDRDCVISFTPKKRHFAGVELYLVQHIPENGGILYVNIQDSSGRQVDTMDLALEKVKDSVWYKVYTNAGLNIGETYTLTFDVSEGAGVPSLMLVNEDYLPDECEAGNLLVSFAYRESTFSFPERVMICMALPALWCLAVRYDCRRCEWKQYLKVAGCFLLLTVGLTWNYMYNSMDVQNSGFAEFQADSETLATGVIYAERDGIYFSGASEKGYGLGRYCDLKGALNHYHLGYMTDDHWLEGYSRTVPQLIVNANDITRRIAVGGNYIRFENGEAYQITETADDGSNIVITLDTDQALRRAKHGSLDDAVFLDPGRQPIAKSLIYAYRSQYGLQGKVFRHMARYMNEDEALVNLNLICALAAAAVFVLIVFLIAVKYNPLLAGCFYLTFLLSPWIVNFARNLYWVEFTWFIPMAVGLVCVLKADAKKWRAGCYAAAYLAIMGKCLCGYEYISVIMMGLISFLLIDFLCAAVKKERERSRLLFRTIVLTGLAALAGFLTAICIHATLKGEGNIAEGIRIIIENDVLRRTNGADLNDFDSGLWPSINASVWEVYSKYFHFHTEVVTGIAGNLFPLLCIAPLWIFVYEHRKGQLDVQSVFLYVCFFATSVSWFCLGKSHSYVHTHMNYVLWYFGFVQSCFYIIVSRIGKYFFKNNISGISGISG